MSDGSLSTSLPAFKLRVNATGEVAEKTQEAYDGKLENKQAAAEWFEWLIGLKQMWELMLKD